MPSDSVTSATFRGAYDGIDPVPLTDLVIATRRTSHDQRLRFHEDLGTAGKLDAAFIRRRASDALVVTFHGSLDREKFEIPRFERARMTEEFNVSCLYWADPSLWLDDSLELAWYTGAGDLDLAAKLAEHSAQVAESINARRLIFTGSSGGGFAALQASALVPGSTALVFNPQTAISRYWTPVQRRYLEVCAPSLFPVPAEDFDFSVDWSAGLDDRYSAVRRYTSPTENNVVYWTNTNDWHHAKHFQPFSAAVQARSNGSDALTVRNYDGPKSHNVPTAELFREALEECLGMAEGTDTAV